MESLANDDVASGASGRVPSSRMPAAAAGRQVLIGLRVLLAMTVLLGVLYPAVVFGIGRLMPDRADGSPVRGADGAVVGSALIGQQFPGAQWFQGRPSAADYDAMASGGSNLAADNTELAAEIAARRAAIATANGVPASQVPADAVTASASGLDPDISPAYARLQVPRVASARGLEEAAVRRLVDASVQGRELGFLGDQRVNVLQLNLAVQQLRP